MIKLYVKNNCPECDEIEEKFKDLVLAHKLINVDSENFDNSFDRAELPVVQDEGKIIKGSKEIDKFLDEMENFLKEWNKFQSDVCYVDDNGYVICS
jgi:hypothetical protein